MRVRYHHPFSNVFKGQLQLQVSPDFMVTFLQEVTAFLTYNPVTDSLSYLTFRLLSVFNCKDSWDQVIECDKAQWEIGI